MLGWGRDRCASGVPLLTPAPVGCPSGCARDCRGNSRHHGRCPPNRLPARPPCPLKRSFKRGGRGWANPFKQQLANAGARDELKNPDQARRSAA